MAMPRSVGAQLRHRLDSVDGEVDDHLLELSAVSEDLRKFRREIDRNADPLELQLMAEEAQ